MRVCGILQHYYFYHINLEKRKIFQFFYRDNFPLIFGLARRAGAFAGGLLTFALVPGFQLAQHNRGKCHFFSAAFSSQLEAMVGGALARASALHVGLGVGGTTIASGSRVRTSHSWTSRLLTSSFSLGVSSLFCRTTQCM